MTRQEVMDQLEGLRRHCMSMAVDVDTDQKVWMDDAEALKIAISTVQGDDEGLVKSAGEERILHNCILLMNMMFDDFTAYLNFMELDTESEERYQLDVCYAEIVSMLFLWGTSHSGSTSTHQKCRELGVDPYDHVHFDTREEDEENEEEK